MKKADKQLLKAIKKMNPKDIDTAIANGADVNVIGGDSKSALDVAIELGNSELVEKLISTGAEINTTKRKMPLFYAIDSGNPELVQLLIKHKADVNGNLLQEDQSKTHVLGYALEKQEYDIAKLLLENGASVDKLLISDDYAPCALAEKNNLEGLQILAEHGIDLNIQSETDTDGMTPLTIAAQSGYIRMVNFLIEQKTDLNATSQSGMTPLMYAAQNGHQLIVKDLLANGADVNIETEAHENALQFAKESKSDKVVQALIEANGVDKESYSSKLFNGLILFVAGLIGIISLIRTDLEETWQGVVLVFTIIVALIGFIKIIAAIRRWSRYSAYFKNTGKTPPKLIEFQSPQMKKTAVFAIVVVVIAATGFSVKKIIEYRHEQEMIKTLLQRASYMEKEMKAIHTFLPVYFWFSWIEEAETDHYKKNSKFVHLDNLSKELDLSDPEIQKLIRRNNLNEDVVRIFAEAMFTYLDSSKFKQEFSLADDEQSYTIKVFETNDVNYDGDAEDFFLFDSRQGVNNVIFKDKGNRMNIKRFSVNYSTILMMKALENITNQFK